ncbi:hypothetical protein LEP1GSC163_1608 [Leptospira santarosai str. CBC379]|uniref:Uncharacterized protein n=1 Tax=Leptospira santarosai str. MOR084 TaxID=1049984 RepID=A0A0E2BUC3_9LEPT|nr:hypothetical protein LEP1GSC179_2216 [Leptospira santarosai str. MOR084]EKR90034.1 hypothetical protein LEP1GSC163_1608 [Leptospira santarosai str. CBC379]
MNPHKDIDLTLSYFYRKSSGKACYLSNYEKRKIILRLYPLKRIFDLKDKSILF